MTPPDSSEREVENARWREDRCPHGRAYRGRCCQQCRPTRVFLDRDLAQRILAALEEEADTNAPFVSESRLRALAAELRARVPTKGRQEVP